MQRERHDKAPAGGHTYGNNCFANRLVAQAEAANSTPRGIGRSDQEGRRGQTTPPAVQYPNSLTLFVTHHLHSSHSHPQTSPLTAVRCISTHLSSAQGSLVGEAIPSRSHRFEAELVAAPPSLACPTRLNSTAPPNVSHFAIISDCLAIVRHIKPRLVFSPCLYPYTAVPVLPHWPLTVSLTKVKVSSAYLTRHEMELIYPCSPCAPPVPPMFLFSTPLPSRFC